MNSNQRVWASVLLAAGVFIVTGLPQMLLERLVRSRFQIELKDYYHPTYDAFAAQTLVIGFVLLVGGLILWYLPGRPGPK
jgi:hypothetical protein